MNIAEHIVFMLLETGEGDPNYQDAQMDAIVAALAAKGFKNAYYREFDKYQGVYLVVPGVDKFWIEDWTPTDITLTGENAVRSVVRRHGEEELGGLPHSTVISFFNGEPDLDDFLAYVQEHHGVRLATQAIDKSAIEFMQRSRRKR